MTFTIGCRWSDSYDNKTFTVPKETAAEALAEVDLLEKTVRIEYVDTPDHGRLDVWGFRKLHGKLDQ